MENKIHKTVLIDDDVILGKNNIIHPNTIIQGLTKIGDNNIIGPNVIIGSLGQDTRNPRYDYSNCKIEIGNNNIIREFTAIQKPCYENLTFIGNNVFLMQSVYIPHDAHIYDNVVITPMCVLAGITRILDGANIGMGATINQYNVIGQYSIIATGSATMNNVKPFSKYIPGKKISVNKYAIEKYGFEEQIDEITKYVIEDIFPKNDIIVSIIEKFNTLHFKSGRKIYK
ncbi:hypothetical protein [Flavobacterium sp. CS20]|uniref:hypothetical protein n=1 Tax=Flavobacterium sp. CS20 TaxID=2775246 RepID=UPI001B3A557E|nr:hypothetical protein [Flavobacterium sp. CS20]QTY27705.1 hypothetical protein IGB25_04020 [Flavobacterium sp. CS20]